MTSVAEVMVVGTKSVELVKAFLVLCLYYNSPELFKQRRYHMLNTICVSLLHDVESLPDQLIHTIKLTGHLNKTQVLKTRVMMNTVNWY